MATGPLITLGTVLKDKSNQMIMALRKNLQEDDTIASRKLIQSIKTNVKVFGDVFTMELWMEDYWKNVDKGTPPGKMPDVAKIYRWMQHKGIGANLLKRGKGSRSNGIRRTGTDARMKLAYRIAKAIQRKGTIKRFGYKGSNFYSDVINPVWVSKFKEELSKQLKRNYTIEIVNAVN